MRKIAILQPNYIPWKGVFDLASRVDVFVFYDDVQYTVKDWRNRNIVKSPNGPIWLTVPVLSKGRRDQLICDALIDLESNWQEKHLKTLVNCYSKARFFRQYEYLLQELYLGTKWERIAELDIHATRLLARALDIEVEWVIASDLAQVGSKDGEKVLNICNLLRCDYFLNGPSSRAFMNERLFTERGVSLDFIEYDYPEYPQLFGSFVHQVSVLDVLFNCGPEARQMVCRGGFSN